jgi:hypothetical protein
MLSYSVLLKYPSDYKLFLDKDFVTNTILKTGLELANNPKAMMAEGCALYLNLVFEKCLNAVETLEGDEIKLR